MAESFDFEGAWNAVASYWSRDWGGSGLARLRGAGAGGGSRSDWLGDDLVDEWPRGAGPACVAGVARLNPLARILATIGFMYRAGRLSELERTVLKEKALGMSVGSQDWLRMTGCHGAARSSAPPPLSRRHLAPPALAENDLYVDAAVRVLQEDRRLDECLCVRSSARTVDAPAASVDEADRTFAADRGPDGGTVEVAWVELSGAVARPSASLTPSSLVPFPDSSPQLDSSDTLRRIVAIHLRNESRRVAAAALHTAGVSASPAPAAGYAAGGGASAAARSSVSATALPLASPTKHRGASPADAGFGARAEGSGFTTRTSPARPSPADLLRASTVAR